MADRLVLDDMSVDDLMDHARDLDAEMDDMRAYRDEVQRAIGERIEAGDVPADSRPRAED